MYGWFSPYLVKDKDRELVGFSGGMMLGIVLWIISGGRSFDTASARVEFWRIFFIILLRSRYKPADRPFDSSDQGIHFCFTRAGMLLARHCHAQFT